MEEKEMGRGEENRALSRDHKIRETQRDKKVLTRSQRRVMGKEKNTQYDLQ